MNKDQKFLTVEKLAKVLDVPKSWIYERTRHNAIPHFKMGKYVRFNLDEVAKEGALKSRSKGNRLGTNVCLKARARSRS